MKKIFALLAMTYCVSSLIAQNEKGVVYLKNGTILKGKYSYFQNSEKLRIETAGNVWVFSAEEIDSIKGKRDRISGEEEFVTTDSPYFFRTEIGILAGNSENSQSAPFSLTGTVNYKVKGNFSAGAGLGVEFLKESYMPAFLNLEYLLRHTTTSPYFFLKAGYQVPLEESRTVYYDVYPAWSSIWPGPGYYGQDNLDAKGGILINPGLGFTHKFSSSLGMSFAFGYQFHRLRYTGEKDYSMDIDYNRLTIKLGIVFN
jgi:hypothetical protein